MIVLKILNTRWRAKTYGLSLMVTALKALAVIYGRRRQCRGYDEKKSLPSEKRKVSDG